MDFRQLRTFSCVAELGSLSKASDTLRVAQPALSRQIKLLEHELRAELFTRNGRGMVLTDAGRLLLARTSGIVRQIDQIRDEIQSAGGPPSGRVVLGLVPTVSCVISARLARRTVDKYPGISLLHRRKLQRPSDRMAAPRRDGSGADLRAVGRPASDRAEPRPRSHRGGGAARQRAARKKKQVDIGWLLRQTLVLPSHSHGLRALIEQAAAKKKIKLDVKLEADSFRVLTSLVEEGLGYTLLPPSSVRNEVADGRLETAAIAKPAPMRELTLASPIDHPGSTAITLVTELLRDELTACREEGLWDIKLA